MNPFADFEKTDISNVVINEDYFKSFEDNEDHMLLDMDSLVQRKDEDVLLTRIVDSTKKCPFEMEPEEEDCLGWHIKPVEEWSQTDTTNWLMSAAQSIGLTYAQTPTTLALPGKDLLALGRSGFHASDPLHGDRFYEVLQNDLAELQYKRDFPGRSAETFQKLSISEDEREQTNVGSNNVSDAESDNSIEISTKRPPGRPRLLKTKKNPTSQGKLWEFIRDLLRNRKTCPSLICWEDYSQAKFRFVRSDEVAKLWGSRKGNTKMTYEKLSRAMRYYYKRKIFLPVLGRRLVYQFGPNATGWQTDNPNFRF